MKIKRNLQLTLMKLIIIITGRKYYICDHCKKVHKFVGDEFATCCGKYKNYAFVSNDCAEKAVKEARETVWNKANIFI